MTAARLIKIFRNGRNQALRIPREFELDTSEASIRKDRGRLIIEPIKKAGLLATLATLPSLKVEFPDISEELPPVKDLDLWVENVFYWTQTLCRIWFETPQEE